MLEGRVMFRKIKAYLSCISGHTAMIFALSAIPIVMAVGAAVDYSRASRVQSVLQSAVDAAILGAASDPILVAKLTQGGGQAELRQKIEAYLKSNNAEDALDSAMNITVKFDLDTNNLSVSAGGEVKTSMMRLAGFNRLDVGVNAEVGVGSNALEVALVLDNTKSMEGSKFDNLRIAAKELVENLEDSAANKASLKISLVPFARYVNVGPTTTNRKAKWMDVPADTGSEKWYGCAGHRGESHLDRIDGGPAYPGILEGNSRRLDCPGEIVGLTTDTNRIKSAIADMFLAYGTFIPGGLLWGWNTLDHDAPYTEAMEKKERQSKGGRRVMVLLTDGMNSVTTDNSSPVRDLEPHPDEDALTLRLCTKIKNDQIDLYTIAFGLNANPKEVEMKDLLSECATRPDMAFDAKDGPALKAAFGKIARELSTIYLAR
jgi:Flp pilus assembly protein TadG